MPTFSFGFEIVSASSPLPQDGLLLVRGLGLTKLCMFGRSLFRHGGVRLNARDEGLVSAHFGGSRAVSADVVAIDEKV